jgi:D-alanine-D-alanine ligase
LKVQSRIENRKSKICVGLIFGGKSGEHEVSLASAQSVARAIDRNKYDVVLIGITKEGKWIVGDNALRYLATLSPTSLLAPDDARAEDVQSAPMDSADLVPGVMTHSPLTMIDVAFPLVHGPFGEDGTLQGLLEMADVPYVGAGVAASAVGMDKALMKAIFSAHHLPVTDWLVILRREWRAQPEEVIYRIERALGYPCFIKPANLGSSVGVTKARRRDELSRALDVAAQYDRKMLAERAIVNAREIECSVLGNDEPIASVPGEVIPQREFYDYTAKYASDSGTALVVPADLSPELVQLVQEMALHAFKAIDACGMARVDFFLERDTQKLWVNEINTIPGFTSVSMYPRMWQATGLGYTELIDRLIQLALERYDDKHKSKIAYEP